MINLAEYLRLSSNTLIKNVNHAWSFNSRVTEFEEWHINETLVKELQFRRLSELDFSEQIARSCRANQLLIGSCIWAFRMTLGLEASMYVIFT